MKIDIQKNYEYYNDLCGVPSNPVDAFIRAEDLSRQTGRTTAMIESLPSDGRAIIVVHNAASITFIKDAIIAHHGSTYPIKKLKIISKNCFEQGYARGYCMPVYFDHVVFFEQNLRYIQDIQAIYNPGAK